MSVFERIFAQARARPDKPAIIFNDNIVGYGTFAAGIEVARRFLAGQDLSRDRVAVICIHNALDAWIIGLALRCLGVTTVQAQSADDLARLGLSRISAVTIQSEAARWSGLADAATRAGAPVVVAPNGLFSSVGSVDLGKAGEGVGATGGYLLLTSGTTGAYKKVYLDDAIDQSNLNSRVEIFGYTSESVINLFDFGGWTAAGYQLPIMAWSLGAAVVVRQRRDRYRSLAAPGLTHAFVQPEFLADLLATPAHIPLRNDAMMLISTGGVLSLAQWHAARERLTRNVWTCVGSTEVGAFTMTRIETAEDLQGHRITPFRDVQIVDEHDRVLPDGAIGAIRIRTNGVEGYLDDPDTTRAFFRDSYFYPGDLGMRRADGQLSLQGRMTDVVNVMGDKIATLPIEVAIQTRLEAAAVCVFSVPDAAGETVHVVVQPGRAVTPEEVQAAVLASNARIKGARVHLVESVPRNHMGKIERAALRTQVLTAAN